MFFAFLCDIWNMSSGTPWVLLHASSSDAFYIAAPFPWLGKVAVHSADPLVSLFSCKPGGILYAQSS
jgi:hypothetical protein